MGLHNVAEIVTSDVGFSFNLNALHHASASALSNEGGGHLGELLVHVASNSERVFNEIFFLYNVESSSGDGH